MKKLSLSILILMMCITLSFAYEKVKSESCKNWESGINIGVANFTIRYNMVKEPRFNQPRHAAMNNLLSKNNIDRKTYWYSKIGVSASNLKGAVAVSPVNIERWKIPVIVPRSVATLRRNDNLNSDVEVSGTKRYTLAGI